MLEFYFHFGKKEQTSFYILRELKDILFSPFLNAKPYAPIGKITKDFLRV